MRMSFLINKLLFLRDYGLTFIFSPAQYVLYTVCMLTENGHNNYQVINYKNGEKAGFGNYISDITFNKETVINLSIFLQKRLRKRGYGRMT